MEWFHQHGVNMDEVEKPLRILDQTVQCLKESERVDTRMITKEEYESRKKEVWELLSKFYGLIFYQKALMLIAFKLVGDITKFDKDTLQVAGILKEMEEEEDEEVSEDEEEREEEAVSDYVNASWGRLERTFPSIQRNLWQLKQHGMDTSIFREGFGIMTYTIWRLEQEERKAEVETTEERFKEEKEKLGKLLNRLDELLAKMIRPWKDRLRLMEEVASYDRANYQVMYKVVEEEKDSRDSPNTSSVYFANYKKRAL